ncbi:glutamate decarboxylase [Vibrio pectenicida]|uniref:Glutamate decarboxylase n=1 Tax=Vibrio pectenicida TaxID=62763 RepID=A0A7Y3ZZL5_9VIBR|nr:pyridoxal-dependent decarboxylase [Vibrio pectenicida]NOH72017.1 glutamate decarboxylase [Vibrio pectenicida]
MLEIAKDVSGDIELFNFESQVQELFRLLNLGIAKIESKQATGPKFSVEPFLYRNELSKCNIPKYGHTCEEAITALSTIVEGSLRPQSSNEVYNMVPQPAPETVAAASLMQLYNINAIMDSYGGKSLLFEQQISRSVGRLIGWDQASGISCSGGKQTLLYAVKSAIDRIAPEAKSQGVPHDLVILTAEGAHYSIEHVCELAGIGRDACIRIPVSSSNGLDSVTLQNVFEQQVRRGKRVAAIIACGGTTLDFLCDNTATIYESSQKVCNRMELEYFPYLHLDSVIGWLWFSFVSASEFELFQLGFSQQVIQKIKSVTSRFMELDKFDSFGVDFHKNALCPYSSSFFVRKKNLEDERCSKQPLGYGDLSAFKETFENSRSSSGIASAWVALQRFGIHGLRKYLGNLLTSAERLKSVFSDDQVSILNESSCGWEVIFSIKPTDELSSRYSPDLLLEGFYDYMQQLVIAGQDVPNVSIIKSFLNNQQSNANHGLIIYNMNPKLTDKDCEVMKADIMECWNDYAQSITCGVTDLNQLSINEPIR